jgi:hypothetical protein
MLLAAGLIAIVAVAACNGDDGDGDGDEDFPQSLVGLFAIVAGVCDADGIVSTGSSFAMTDPANNGIPNTTPTEDCAATNDPLSPGTDGGLLTGQFQPHPDPAFDADDNGLASSITQPRLFFAFNYGIATSADVVPTGGTDEAPVPSITDNGDTDGDGLHELTGDLSAFSIAWQQNYFAQGSPRPTGLPDNSACDETATLDAFPDSDPATPVTGTYDPDTGEYTLDWASRIGAAFPCGNTGHWHFEGIFTPTGS